MTLLKWSGLRNWAADQTTAILHQQGIVARYNLDVQVIPLALELTNVRVDSVDGGDPLLFANRVTVRPRLFSLLNGKFTIDHVDIDSPRIRVVLRSGKLVNLPIELPKSEPDPTNKFEVPFNVFAVTDASIDLDVDGARLFASDIDIDVSAESEGSGGSILEIALHAGKARFQLARVVGDKGDQDNQGGTAPTVHVDDDALCFIDARLRYEPNRITVRRFTATGSVDLDPFPDTTPRCDLDLTDKRRVEVEMNYVRVFLPPTHDDKLRVDARRIRARAPLALAQRAVSLPETDGWIGLDLGGQYTGTTMLPEISGTLEAHDIKLDHFRFAQEIHADFAIQRDIIRSKSLVVRIADGEAALSNVVVKDLARGGAIEASAMLRGINFTSLMRDLGVHPHSYVAWDIKDISLPKLRGTFVPLKLDADFVAHTTGFAIYDHPATDPARARLFGLGTADITAHLAVRPNAVEFQRANVRVGGASHVEGAFVSLGFDEQIRAEVPHAHVDLADITPVGAVHMGGKADLEFHMGGKFSHPTPEGEIRNFEDFSVADLRFGNLSSGRFKLDVSGPVLDLSGVRAKKGASPYEVPSVRLDFGRHGGGFVVDALATSTGLGLRDLFAMFKLEDDPRFEGLDA
ncbi:MAG: hypothetical protein WCI05_15785, partial [Myxococcales bacterium]